MTNQGQVLPNQKKGSNNGGSNNINEDIKPRTAAPTQGAQDNSPTSMKISNLGQVLPNKKARTAAPTQGAKDSGLAINEDGKPRTGASEPEKKKQGQTLQHRETRTAIHDH